MKWTIVALDDTTGEVITCVQNATGPHEAMHKTAREIARKRHYDVQIICAIRGDAETCAPCEDTGKAAYVRDLA